MLIAQLIIVAFLSLIWAIILRAAVRWVEGDEVAYGDAYLAMLLAGVVNVILGAAFEAIAGGQIGILLLLIPLNFLIQSGFISAMIGMPFSRACLVSLAMIAIFVAIGLLLMIPIFLIAVLVL